VPLPISNLKLALLLSQNPIGKAKFEFIVNEELVIFSMILVSDK
jgi:hypothetical protein